MRVSIFNALKARYDAMPPAGNPLNAFLAQHGLNIADNATATALAVSHHNQSKAFAGQAEDATQDRNNIWNPVIAHLRAIGGFLISLYKDNPKELNLWGFNVDDSPRAPRQVKSKVKLMGQLTVNSLIIGGTFRNTGTVPLTTYKGKAATGPFVLVNPGEGSPRDMAPSLWSMRHPPPLASFLPSDTVDAITVSLTTMSIPIFLRVREDA